MMHIRNILPPIRVHVWGGFGSQLYASALKFDIENRFPNRRIRMLFHSSGVTPRFIEVQNSEGSLVQVLDGENRDLFVRFIRSILKLLMFKVGFLNTCDTNVEWSKLRPWVLVIRGHYSYRIISSSTIRTVTLREIGLDMKQVHANSDYLMHYRIGDLATLDEKDYIKGDRFGKVFQKIGVLPKSEISVCTDSPNIAQIELSQYPMNFLIADKGPIQTLQDSICAGYFVGTTAKISYWAVACREYFQIGPSAIPIGHQISIERTIGKVPERVELY